VHLLRKKDETFENFKKFQANIDRSSDECKIITLRRNNDDEYINQKFQNYLAAESINEDSRVSYVPEQNDETERLNRILMYKIRSILNQQNRKISRDM
jgi:hypothetical protein